MDKRNSQLAQIHIAKKDLGLDDETYRALLIDVSGVDSSKDLDAAGRRAVLARFKAKGWKNKKQAGKPINVAKNKAKLISKIGALLADMKLPWSYADAIRKQMNFRAVRLEWCSQLELSAIITALVNRSKKV